MATNDPKGAKSLLSTLASAGTMVCVLHSFENLLGTRSFSDVDTVIDTHPINAIRLLKQKQTEFSPILIWEYDRNAYSSFWSNCDGSRGVQLDFLYDPRGRGKYGVKTGELLDRKVAAFEKVWRLDDESELIYLLIKRIYKHEYPRAKLHLESLRQGFPAWERTCLEIAPRMRGKIKRFERGATTNHRVRHGRALLKFYEPRFLRRLIHPPGARITLNSLRLAENLYGDLIKFLPSVAIQTKGTHRITDLLTRLKPSVVLAVSHNAHDGPATREQIIAELVRRTNRVLRPCKA